VFGLIANALDIFKNKKNGQDELPNP
jgi:hypothetical protein